MAFITPTIEDISNNIISQLQTTLNQAIPLLPKSFLRVLSKVLGGLFIIWYKYAGFQFLQIFVTTASNEKTEINGNIVRPLEEWGILVGVGSPIAATQAEMEINIIVENQVGVLPALTQLVGQNNGVTYITLADVPLAAPIVQAVVRAVADQSGGQGAGQIGNLETGDIISFANPIPNVARDTTVDTRTITGADAETTEAYRKRILDRFQSPPQGGAYADYVQWGLEVAGIANIYPYTGDPGIVEVYVESATEPDGIPDTAQLDAVSDSIELDSGGLATRRPVNAFVNVLPITRTGFDVIVFGLDQVSNPTAVQTQIEAALEQYFLDREPFITGVSVPSRKDLITYSGVLAVVQLIVASNSGIINNVSLIESGTPINFRPLTRGEKSKLSSVTFTT